MVIKGGRIYIPLIHSELVVCAILARKAAYIASQKSLYCAPKEALLPDNIGSVRKCSDFS